MISNATRALLNFAGFVVVCWVGYVVYGFFTGNGLWRIVEDALSSDYRRASPAAVFAACALIGIVAVFALAWLVWRLFLRGRPDDSFPSAKLNR
jgi:succinate dehydrogenase hydrophobic anchor subunit